jgi:uncharacterized protein (TIGR02466 family)
MKAVIDRTLAGPDGFDLSFNARSLELLTKFATPFIVAPLNAPERLNQALRQVILEHASRDPGVALSNHGGWQSHADFADWSGPAGEALLVAARGLADSFTAIATTEGPHIGGPVWTVNAWANVNGAGHGNHAHHHPAAFWSGVYWVDAGEAAEGEPRGGELEMHDPRGVLPAFYAPRLRYWVPGCLSAGGQDFFEPRAGVMALFPAWLVHAVRPYAGPGLRISIAFNLSV